MYNDFLVENLLFDDERKKFFDNEFAIITKPFIKNCGTFFSQGEELKVCEYDNSLYFNSLYFNLTNGRESAGINVSGVENYCGGVFLHGLTYTKKELAITLLRAVLNYVKEEGYNTVQYIATEHQPVLVKLFTNLGFNKSFESYNRRTDHIIYGFDLTISNVEGDFDTLLRPTCPKEWLDQFKNGLSNVTTANMFDLIKYEEVKDDNF